jgi:acetyl esterase/lipase
MLSPRLTRSIRRRALRAAATGLSLVAAPLAVIAPPRARRRLWRLEDDWWTRRSWHEHMARNRLRFDDVEERAIRFGPHPRQQAFWFHPLRPTSARQPLLLFVHGGGWTSGSAEYHAFLGRHVAHLGFPAVVAGYRLLPDVTLPAMLSDLTAGLRLGLTESRGRGWHGGVAAIGQSAGGHLAALLTLAGSSFLGDEDVSDEIGGLVTLGAVLDFSQPGDDLRETAARLAGPGRDGGSADPAHYAVDTRNVPILCIHGREDWLVDQQQSRSFVDRVNQHGGRADLMLLPGRHHADLIDVLYDGSPQGVRVQRWIESHVCPGRQ